MTAAQLTVDTNEGNGTLYWVVTQSSVAPSAVLVEAGLDEDAQPADLAGSQAVSGTGTQVVETEESPGLQVGVGSPAEPMYWAHFMQKDAAGNRSAVVTSAMFTLSAGDFEIMTWNSADKAAGITLFDGDREAWHATNTLEWVRATKAISSGKWCWALHIDMPSTFRTGIATAAFNLDTDTLGVGTTSVSISNGGLVAFNSSTLADYTDYVVGDILMVCFDEDAGDIWFGRNGTWNGDPDAGTGAIKSDIAAGTWYPIFGSNGTGPLGKCTIIPWPYAIPSGATTLVPPVYPDAKHWETIHFQPLTGSNGGWNGFNLRQLLTNAQLVDKTGTKIRVRLRSGSTESSQVDSAHFGNQAGAGDAWDMAAAGTPLNFSGSNAFTIAGGATIAQSDEITFAYAGGAALLFNFHFNSAAADVIGTAAVAYTHYTKSAASETGVANVTGYGTTATSLRFVQEVQVYVDDI